MTMITPRFPMFSGQFNAPVTTRFGHLQGDSVQFGSRQADAERAVRENNEKLHAVLNDYGRVYSHAGDVDPVLSWVRNTIGKQGGMSGENYDVLRALEETRIGEVRNNLREQALDCIRQGGDPATPVDYEKSYNQDVREPALQWAIGNHDVEMATAFFEASPEASTELFRSNNNIIGDLLMTGLNVAAIKPQGYDADDALDQAVLKHIGVEALAGYKSYNSSFLAEAVLKLRPAFVQAFAQDGRYLSDIDQVIKPVTEKVDQGVMIFDSKGHRTSPKGGKGRMLLDDLTWAENALALGEQALDPGNVGQKALYDEAAGKLRDRLQEIREERNLVGLTS